MPAASLTDIANRCGTDKGTVGPSEEWHANNYTDVYAGYLHHMRYQPIRLLEIGGGIPGPNFVANIAHGTNVEGGGSLKMWREFFPNGTICVLDINDPAVLQKYGIVTAQADQSDPAALQRASDHFAANGASEFDVIVDDGSHDPEHQQISFAKLWPRVVSGGLYIIEDLQSNGMNDPERSRFRFHSDRVLSTRDVFAHVQKTGTFPEQCLISGIDPAEIALVSFHSPVLQYREIAKQMIGRVLRRKAIRPYGPAKIVVCAKA
jgi:hypothetical protein